MKKFISQCRMKLRTKEGFTLLEMILATALVAIFFSMAVTILPVWFQSYRNMITVSYARQIANGIIKAVEMQVMFADEVQLSTAPGEAGKVMGRNKEGEFLIPEEKDGELLIEGLVYDKKFYRGMHADLSFSVENGKYCTVIVIIKNEDNQEILKRERSIKLVGKAA